MNPDFRVRGNRIARRMLSRVGKCVTHAVKRDNATIFFSRRRRRSARSRASGKNLPMVVRSIRDDSGRARPSPPRSPAPTRPTNFQWRRQRVVVAARLLLNLQVWKRATRRRALPKLIQKKRNQSVLLETIALARRGVSRPPARVSLTHSAVRSSNRVEATHRG